MKDVFGNPLAIGDTVAFTEPGYTYELKTGEIIKFTPKKIVIRWKDKYDGLVDTYKFPKQVAKKPTVLDVEVKVVDEKIISREYLITLSDEYDEVMEGERNHWHAIIEDENGTYRWKSDPKVEVLVNDPSFSLNDWWETQYKMNPKAKNDPSVRKFYRDMGYSISGYWEIFYWEVNNEYADEWEG